MAKKKRRGKYKSRKKRGAGLSSRTVYNLTGLALFGAGGVILASYLRNGSILTRINDQSILLFGMFSFLIALNLLVFALLSWRVKMLLTRINFPIGFVVFTISMLGLFRSGVIGEQINASLSSIVGESVALVIFTLGILIGFVVFSNLSIPAMVEKIAEGIKQISGRGKNKFAPLLDRKKDIVVNESKPVNIQGIKDKPVVPAMQFQKPSENPNTQPPSGNHTEDIDQDQDIIMNKAFKIGIWEYPPLSLLSDHHDKKAERGDIKKTAGIIEKTLGSFAIQSRVAEINVGPSVTQYAIEIALGTKLSKITGLGNDLALATEAPTGQVRIEAPIPGRNLVGIEIPNRTLELVSLKTMLGSSQMQKAKSKLSVPLGLDVSGTPIIVDIAKMPHVMIAGTTGSGKSVLMNAFVTSLLYRASPAEVKLIMIDPKRVELTGYNDIPHLLAPVVVEPPQAVSALKWAIKVMEKRYIKFAESGVKNIDSYNELAGFQALPYIVIFIDELADLMAVAAVEVEDSIARLAQMARATGIHLVLATQRPSVDVITGLIKANIPCRIAFNVSSMIDSKVILDSPGAEKLLGRGDMLYVPPDQPKPTRIQGAFVSEQDAKRVVNFIKARGVPVEYTQEVLEQSVSLKNGRGSIQGANGSAGSDREPLFDEAVRIVCQYDRASSSLLQRRLQIGFNKAARILEQMEAAGIVGPADGAKPREVLAKNADQALASQNTSA